MCVLHSGYSYKVISLLIMIFLYFFSFFEFVNNYAVFVAVDITTVVKQI